MSGRGRVQIVTFKLHIRDATVCIFNGVKKHGNVLCCCHWMNIQDA